MTRFWTRFWLLVISSCRVGSFVLLFLFFFVFCFFMSILWNYELEVSCNYSSFLFFFINPLATTDTIWCRLTLVTLLVAAIRFDDRFCVSQNSGIEGGGLAYSWHAVHMAVVLAVERPWSALARPFLTLLAQMGNKNHSSPFVEAPFLDL